MLDAKYYWACICYWITDKIGFKYPYPVDGQMIYKFPKFQRWLGSQIPYDSW